MLKTCVSFVKDSNWERLLLSIRILVWEDTHQSSRYLHSKKPYLKYSWSLLSWVFKNISLRKRMLDIGWNPSLSRNAWFKKEEGFVLDRLTRILLN